MFFPDMSCMSHIFWRNLCVGTHPAFLGLCKYFLMAYHASRRFSIARITSGNMYFMSIGSPRYALSHEHRLCDSDLIPGGKSVLYLFCFFILTFLIHNSCYAAPITSFSSFALKLRRMEGHRVNIPHALLRGVVF